jgi:hypothetical protein
MGQIFEFDPLIIGKPLKALPLIYALLGGLKDKSYLIRRLYGTA